MLFFENLFFLYLGVFCPFLTTFIKPNKPAFYFSPFWAIPYVCL